MLGTFAGDDIHMVRWATRITGPPGHVNCLGKDTAAHSLMTFAALQWLIWPRGTLMFSLPSCLPRVTSAASPFISGGCTDVPALPGLQVRNTPGNCMGDSFDWLVTFTYFLGDLLWQPAVFCLLFDAMNHDFEAECVPVLLSVPSSGPCMPVSWPGPFQSWSPLCNLETCLLPDLCVHEAHLLVVVSSSTI